MKKETRTKLISKGWSPEDIKKTEEIISSRSLHDKSRSIAHTNKILFWSVMFVIIIGNTLVALILIPLLLVMSKLAMDFFVVILGFTVGLLFNFLVWEIEQYLTKKEHLFAAVIIPIVAVLDLYAMVKISNSINDVFQITAVRENPMAISALYVIAFLLPYLFTLFYKKKIKTYL